MNTLLELDNRARLFVEEDGALRRAEAAEIKERLDSGQGFVQPLTKRETQERNGYPHCFCHERETTAIAIVMPKSRFDRIIAYCPLRDKNFHSPQILL